MGWHLILLVAILPAFSTAFVQQFHISQPHLTVETFTHVVHRETSDRHGREGFHLDTSASHIPHTCLNTHTQSLSIWPEIHFDVGNLQGMTHGDQGRCVFCPHNPGDTCHLEDIAFGNLLLDDSAQCGGLHIHSTTCHSLASCDLFAPDIHHARPALGIHMRPFCHGLLLRLSQCGHEFWHPRHRLRQFGGIRATALRHVRAPTAFATHERGHLP
jgi:hypothetical protein